MNKNLITAFKKWFIPEGSGTYLGVARVFFYSILFILAAKENIKDFALVPKILWTPPGIYKILNSDFVYSFETLKTLHVVWLISLLFSAIGLFGRISMMASFLLALIVLGFPLGFIPSRFHVYLPTVALGILSFSRANDFFSVDSFIRNRFFVNRNSKNDVSTEYGWPARLILFNLVMMYFSAALSKLRYAGLNWVSEQNIAYHLLKARGNFKENLYTWTNPIVDFAVKNSPLLSAAALFVLILELLSPIAFFKESSLKYFLIFWFLLHLSIAFFMGIYVSYWYLTIVPFFIPFYRFKFLRKIVGPS